MRRPRARGYAPRASGRPRVAVRSNYVGLPSMAGRGADEGGRKPAGSGRAKSRPGRRPEVTAPGTEIAAIEPREAPAVLATGPRQDGKTGAPLGAPSPHLARGEKACPRAGGEDDGLPGAAKNTGGGALASPVIPGREPQARLRASSTRYASEPGIQRCRHCAGFWIPGPALMRRPGMTMDGLFDNRIGTANERSRYFSDNASPLKSALTMRPVCPPESVSTAPLWLVSTTACAPRTTAAPAPAWP